MYNEKNVLPEDFDGVFRFTNFTNGEFKAKWNSVEYTFPPMKTTPLIIAGATPEEVQNIRKKFAKELAVEIFYGTKKFKDMDKNPTGDWKRSATYTESDLAPFIQRCLEPLPAAQAKARALPKDDGEKYHKDEEGKPVTRILKANESLRKEASGIVA